MSTNHSADLTGFADDRALFGELLATRKIDGLTDDRPISRLGVEREIHFVDREGNAAFAADDIVNGVNQRWMMSEFARSSAETVSGRHDVGPGVFQQIWTEMRDREERIREFLAGNIPSVRPLFAGVLASVGEDWLGRGEEMVSRRKARYLGFMRKLHQRHGSYTFTLPGEGGDRVINVPSSPVPGGLTAGFSLNAQFHPADIGLALDLTAALAWIAPVLSSTSPFAFGRPAAWNSRHFVWKHGQSPRGELTPFGCGAYLGTRGIEVCLDWQQFLAKQEPLLKFEETDVDPAEPLAATRLRCGTSWLLTGRLRTAVPEDELVSHIEFRATDTGLTLLDDVADCALTAGAAVALIQRIERAEELLRYDDAERALIACATTGDAEIVWRGKKRSAREIILDEIVPLAEDGLKLMGIAPAHIRRLLMCCVKRIEQRRTGADWMLNRFRATRGGENGVREVLKEASLLQAVQPANFDSAVSVADW